LLARVLGGLKRARDFKHIVPEGFGACSIGILIFHNSLVNDRSRSGGRGRER
jgi:hypothetical protein